MNVIPFVSRKTRALRAWLQAHHRSLPTIVLTGDEREAHVRWNRLVAVKVQGDDPRLRIGLSFPTFENEPPPLGNIPPVGASTMISDYGDSADPVVLALLAWRCMKDDDRSLRVQALPVAERWTEVEPANHLAWLVLATLQWQAGDPQAAIETMRRGAGASSWREYETAFAVPAADAITGPYFTPRQRLCALGTVQYLMIGRLADCTVGFFHEAAQDITLRPLIVKLLAAQWRDGDSPYALWSCGTDAATAGLDAATIAERTQRSDAYWWMRVSRRTEGIPPWPPNAECEAMFERIRREWIVGERQLLLEALAEAGIDEGEAARRYVAGLDAHGRDLRERLMIAKPIAEGPMRGPL